VSERIERLAIIGVGLIGGSLARDLRARGVCDEIVGCSRQVGHLERAVELGVIDRFETGIGRAVRGADLIVVAVPMGAMATVFSAMRPSLAADAVVTDAGSAKCAVIEAARTAFDGVPSCFVPGHPIAGTERSGVEASVLGLYCGRRVILTPTVATEASALARVRWMWGCTGAEVVEMECGHHDQVLAATSHLPHVLAYTLVDTLAQMQDKTEIFRFAAGGFRDFTRIAASDPQMWHDICVANREALLGSLECFMADLDRLAKAIRDGDGEFMGSVFRRAQAARARFSDA